MKKEVEKLRDENRSLKDKINDMTMMLYKKLEQANIVDHKTENTQMQQILANQ